MPCVINNDGYVTYETLFITSGKAITRNWCIIGEIHAMEEMTYELRAREKDSVRKCLIYDKVENAHGPTVYI